MSRPRLLLVPFVTELEWAKLEPLVADWADTARFDAPGVGGEPLPDELMNLDETFGGDSAAALARWREATAERALREVEASGWNSYFVIADSYGITAGVEVARRDRHRVRGIALGHAALSHDTEGPRAPVSREIREAMTVLMRTDAAGFIAYGISQATQGAVSEEEAEQWLARFPDQELVSALWTALGENPEPVGDALRELDLPLLLAQHVGCLSETQEGFDDIVAAFPEAQTVGCPEACAVSPAFAVALREFCEQTERS